MSTQTLQKNLLPYVSYAALSGAVFDEDGMSITDALTRSGLNYVVKDIPFTGYDTTPSGTIAVPCPEDFQRMLVRVDPDGTRIAFPVVGVRYRVMQNITAFAVLQALVDNKEAKIVAAAAYGRPMGVKAFVAMELPEPLLIGDADEVIDVYLIARQHHDGNAFSMSIAPRMRSTGALVETNIPGTPQSWSLHHSGDIEKKVEEAALTIRHIKDWEKAYTGVTTRMLATRITGEQFDKAIRKLLPTPALASEKAAENWAERRLDVRRLFEATKGGFGAGTVYAAYNAVAVYVDHFAPARGDANSQRMMRVVNEDAGRLKRKAWDLFTGVTN